MEVLLTLRLGAADCRMSNGQILTEVWWHDSFTAALGKSRFVSHQKQS